MQTDIEREIIERLTRIETKQDNISLEIVKLDDRLCRTEEKVSEHELIIKAISKGGNWWLQVIGSGIGVLIGAMLVSIIKGCA